MKKIYTRILAVSSLFIFGVHYLNAQCGIPIPSVSGNTLVCGSSASFTLTATGSSSITTWYASTAGNPTISSNAVFVTPNLTSNTTYYVTQSVYGTTSLSLPAQNNTYSGMTRGYYFVAPQAYTLTGVRVPTDASTANSNIAILSFGQGNTPPNYPSITNSFTILYLAQNVSGTGTISINIPIASGDVIGVLGDRGGINSYGNGGVNTFGGVNLTIARMGMQYPLGSTSPQDIWSETGATSISRVELYADGLCTTQMDTVTTIVSNPAQISILGPTAALCIDTTAISLMAIGASNYTWSTGPNTTTISVPGNVSATYSVTSSNNYGCVSNVATIQVSIQPLPAVAIVPSSTVICAGNSGTLTASGASSYVWSSGFTTTTLVITPNATSSYVLTGTDDYGCVNTATLTLPVSPNPTVTVNASKTTVCIGESITLSAGGAASYSWNTGASTQSISVILTGPTNYTAVGTNTAGCARKKVIAINALICTGIQENGGNDNSISVFPNPFTGQISIQSDAVIRQIVLKDISGRIILNETVESLRLVHLNLEQLNAGIYFIELPQNAGGAPIKVVKE